LATTVSLIVGCGTVGSGRAAVIRVPEAVTGIQAAINVALSGDTVLVARGTYTGGVVIAGKSVTLASLYVVTGDTNDIALTTLTGSGTILAIQPTAGEGTTVRGLTFVDGDHQLQNFGQQARILDNHFIRGSDQVSFENASGVVRGCTFFHASDDGIDIDNSSEPTIENNTILRRRKRRDRDAPARLHRAHAADRHPRKLHLRERRGRDPAHRLSRRFEPGHPDRGQRPGGQRDGGTRLHERRQHRRGLCRRPLGRAGPRHRQHDLRQPHRGHRWRQHAAHEQHHRRQYAVRGEARHHELARVVQLFWGNGTNYTNSIVTTSTTLLVDPLMGTDYDLDPQSPCIDAGAVSMMWNGRKVGAPAYLGPAPDLGARESAGGTTLSAPGASHPSGLALTRVRPNPVSDSVAISFTLIVEAPTRIELTDIAGGCCWCGSWARCTQGTTP
jgi:parallel beta-helix repeat protein